jgi:aryl-alcohol dehydrogenase-like predicted oxidoreductase
MQLQALGSSELKVTRIGYGCMSLGGSWESTPLNEITRKEAVKSIRSALDEGINFFDHADIYARGKSEEAFSTIWADTPRLRE